MIIYDIERFTKVFFLGIIQGFTEFFPISSTAHLILISDWIGFDSSSEQFFEVMMQCGSVLAIICFFRKNLLNLIKGLCLFIPNKIKLMHKLLVALLPIIIIGPFSIKVVKSLYYPKIVAIAMILGGVIILWVENRTYYLIYNTEYKFSDILEKISLKQAIIIGLVQCLAIIPGFSRSGTTIIGGIFVGLNRKIATEFSFLLAIPTIIGASIHDLYHHSSKLTISSFLDILIGFFSSFLISLIMIRIVFKFIETHTYRIFAWYRLIFGGIILIIYLIR
ncbi:MAG: undecaprenyl-diphosphate phosphatase [Bordetella sp.]|nr:MAG: undecaprenyl-diphosphate phosphatase [Bordetella sp.]